MDFKMSEVTEKENSLEFNIHGVDVSVVNSLRRVLLTRIETLVFRGFPYAQNKLEFIRNKTKFNNEYLKHRIQCIPIFESDDTKYENFVQNFKVVLNVQNHTNELLYVTTRDFKLINQVNGKAVDPVQVRKLFPPDPVSQDFIPICVLMPKLTETDEPEGLELSLSFTTGCAKEDACWNVVSKCCYFNLEDDAKVNEAMSKIKDEVERKDFQLLDAQRLYLPNEFHMIIHSNGIFEPKQLLAKACNYLIERFQDLTLFLSTQTAVSEERYDTIEPFAIYKEETNTVPIYHLRIEQDDFTLGKLIENYLNLMFRQEFLYIAFKKVHPHDSHCFISFSYRNEDKPLEVLVSYLDQVSRHVIEIYEKIATVGAK